MSLHTTEAIHHRIIQTREEERLLPYDTSHDLILFLPSWDETRQYFIEGMKPADIDLVSYTSENVIQRIQDYLPFAYDKADGGRGISANRSIAHFRQRLWLLKDDELLAFLENDANYTMYGLPILQKIAEKYMPELIRVEEN